MLRVNPFSYQTVKNHGLNHEASTGLTGLQRSISAARAIKA